MFIVGGSNAYPAEIERALSEHPAIKQAYVVGVPDRAPRRGRLRVRRAAPRRGARPRRRDRVLQGPASPTSRSPATSSSSTEWPLTATGKIQRFLLRERAEDGTSATARPTGEHADPDPPDGWRYLVFTRPGYDEHRRRPPSAPWVSSPASRERFSRGPFPPAALTALATSTKAGPCSRQRHPAFLRRLLHLPRPHRDPRLHADRGLDRAVHQRGDAAADPLLLRRAAPVRAPARQRPALPAHGRHRRGRRRHPPDLLRDARQLVAGRLLQARVARAGRSSGCSRSASPFERLA